MVAELHPSATEWSAATEWWVSIAEAFGELEDNLSRFHGLVIRTRAHDVPLELCQDPIEDVIVALQRGISALREATG